MVFRHRLALNGSESGSRALVHQTEFFILWYLLWRNSIIALVFLRQNFVIIWHFWRTIFVNGTLGLRSRRSWDGLREIFAIIKFQGRSLSSELPAPIPCDSFFRARMSVSSAETSAFTVHGLQIQRTSMNVASAAHRRLRIFQNVVFGCICFYLGVHRYWPFSRSNSSCYLHCSPEKFYFMSL